VSPTPTPSTYDSSKLELVEGLRHVRLRPHMYINSTGNQGLHHLIEEIVANSVDEAMAGHCDRIIIDVAENNWVTVSDNGRGIPVDVHEKSGLSGLELVLTKLGGGGKFGAEDGGYKTSGGLHGVGSSVVNALSTEMKAVVSRDGFEWEQSYQEGVPTGAVTKGAKTDATGTTISWCYDASIFEKGVKYDRVVVEERLRELAALNPGLTFVLRFHGSKEQVIKSAGLSDYLQELVAERDGIEAVHRPPIVLKGEVEEEVEHGDSKRMDSTYIDIALLWSTDDTEHAHSFANSVRTPKGGDHYDGLRSGLRKCLNDVAEELGKFRAKDPKFEQADTREGLYLAISVRVTDPRFESQAKLSLQNPEVAKRVDGFVNGELRKFLLAKENHVIAEAVIERVIEARDARLAASKARSAITQRKGLLGGSGLPGKLADCDSKDREETEIFIVEGDSAGGGLKEKRNRATQAVLPLRGKIQNAEKAGESTLNSDAIKDILTALGGTITPVTVQTKKNGKTVNRTRLVVDLSDVRYGKVVMCSVDYNEMTFVRDAEDHTHCVRIGEFIDGLHESGADPTTWKVLCFDVESGESRFRPLKQAIRHRQDEPMHEIKTAYGRSVKVTSGHSVFVYEDGEIRLKKGDEIAEGDLLVCPRKLPLANGNLPTHLDLVRELRAHPQAAERIFLRGPAVAELRHQRALRGLADMPYTQPRVELTPELCLRLRSARMDLGLPLRELAGVCGAREAASVSEWETGRTRPSVTAVRAYCAHVGLDAETVLSQAVVAPSQLEALHAQSHGSINHGRVRSVMRLSELHEDEIDELGDDLVLASEKHANTTSVGRYLPLDTALFFLIGLYAAEGSISKRGGVRFSLGPADEPWVEEAFAASERLFGVKAVRYEASVGRGFEMRIPSGVASAIFGYVFDFMGRHSHSKRFPNFVFDATPELQLECLRGYYLGDGHYGRSGEVIFTSVSAEMVSQVMYMLLVHGVISGRYVVPAGERTREAYQVKVTARNDLWRIRRLWEGLGEVVEPSSTDGNLEILPPKLNVSEVAAVFGCDEKTVSNAMDSGILSCELPEGHLRRDRLITREAVIKWAKALQSSGRRFVPINEGMVGLPVTSILECESSSEYVYDFSVEEDENFICGTGGAAAHNTDADVDGGHIVTLLMTFFFRFAPSLIRDGRLWAAQLPLFKVEHKKLGRLYVFSDEELQSYMQKDEVKKRSDGTYDVARFKGLGEMDKADLAECALHPETRRLRRVVINDLTEAENMTVLLMGSRVDRRREYIEENALSVEVDV